MSRYDAKTNSFNADGRLMQVEYAMEAINKAGSAIGILTTEGIILASEKQTVSALLEQTKHSEKIFALDNHLYCVVSGLAADANYLIDNARLSCQRHRFVYRDAIPVEQLIQSICDTKQYYTLAGGMRPFGAAFLYAGWDRLYKWQLYSSDPSGNYAGWKSYAIGTNSLAANSFLKEQWEDTLNLTKGLDLAIKALGKTLDTSNPSAEKIEILYVSHKKDGSIYSHNLSEGEINDLITKNDLKGPKKD